MRSNLVRIFSSVFAASFISLGMSSAHAASIQYPTLTPVYYAGQVVNLVPVLSGFEDRSPQCSATQLPSPLTIDRDTCVISGTIDPYGSGAPMIFNTTVLSTETSPINLKISTLPMTIRYPTTTPVFYSGQSVRLVPTLLGFDGRSPQCTSGLLPAGLNIDRNTCVISGTITVPPPSTPTTFYFAVSSPGAMSAEFRILVLPATIQYPTLTPIFYPGQSVRLVPTLLGFDGRTPQCSATQLPPGLSIEASTCVISGTIPLTPPSSPTLYDASISSPEALPTNLKISIFPATIRYPTLTSVFYPGQFVRLIPTLLGFDGRSPACGAGGLPPGLDIERSTCIIYGTISPTLPSSQTVFNVDVFYNMGTSRVSLKIAILPATIQYPTLTPIFYSGQFVRFVPTLLGFEGRSPQCSAGGLPPGLSIEASTCVIYGTVSLPTPNSPTLYHANINSPGTVPYFNNLHILVLPAEASAQPLKRVRFRRTLL